MIVELAGKYRLPAIYPQDEFVEAGGPMFYGVDKILKGAKPADLPVRQLTRIEFVINLKAASKLT